MSRALGGVQFSVFYAAHGVVSVVSPHKLNDAVSGRVREFVLSAILLIVIGFKSKPVRKLSR